MKSIVKMLTTIKVLGHVYLSKHYLFSSCHSFELLPQVHSGQFELRYLSTLLPLADLRHDACLPYSSSWRHVSIRTCYSRDSASNSGPVISNLGDPEQAVSSIYLILTVLLFKRQAG